MLDKLPNLIDPIDFVNHHKQIKARVNQSEFPRLVAQLVDGGQNNRSVEVEMRFFYDKTLKFPAFEMQVKSCLSVECQRSLQPFDIEVNSQVKGIFTESMTLAEDLPSEVEIYEIGDERISLLELIEDELLLSIPLSPINEQAPMAWQEASDETVEQEAEQKPNPFAALEALKSKK
ncbi:YceD family protein [Galenea microaerophila]